MRSEAKQILGKDGLTSIKKLRALVNAEYPKTIDDPAFDRWKELVKKARSDPVYAEGVRIVCWMFKKTPEEIIEGVYEDRKEKGKPERADKYATDFFNLLWKIGKTEEIDFAPKSLGMRAAGFMSFISNVSGSELSKDVRNKYQGFQNVSSDHFHREQLGSTIGRDKLFKIWDHANLTEKAMYGFLMQTGFSRADFFKENFVPKGFYNAVDASMKRTDYPIRPWTTFAYKRKKTYKGKNTFGFVCLYGDGLTWYLKYAKANNIKEGDPWFKGHNGDNITDQTVYNLVTRAAERAGEKLTPKQLREYQGGVLGKNQFGISKPVRDFMTAHRAGDVGEAYSFKNDVVEAAMKTWEWFNPDLYRERRSVAAEEENLNLKEEIKELKRRLKTVEDIVFRAIAPNGKTGVFLDETTEKQVS